MENRSNHVLVGGVVLALLVALAIFVVWLARLGAGNEKEYDIFFKQGANGLAKGSAVSFAGVPSGQVEDVALWPRDPDFVRVRVRVREETPILQGTTAQIQGVGFTGVNQVNLDGAIRGAPPITEIGPAGRPVIPTRPGALGELLSNAPQLLERLTTLTERLSQLLGDRNQASIAGILDNVEQISTSLADRAPEIAATLAQARIAIQQAGDAAEEIGKLSGTTNALLDEQGRPLMADLRQSVAAARTSFANLDAAIGDARPGLQAFSKQTIPEVGLLVKDLRDMSEALKNVSERLDRGGATSILGGQKLPNYEPRN